MQVFVFYEKNDQFLPTCNRSQENKLQVKKEGCMYIFGIQPLPFIWQY